MKSYSVKYSLSTAIERGLKALEKEAKATLRNQYPSDKWVGAEIVADFNPEKGYVVYTMVEETENENL